MCPDERKTITFYVSPSFLCPKAIRGTTCFCQKHFLTSLDLQSFCSSANSERVSVKEQFKGYRVLLPNSYPSKKRRLRSHRLPLKCVRLFMAFGNRQNPKEVNEDLMKTYGDIPIYRYTYGESFSVKGFQTCCPCNNYIQRKSKKKYRCEMRVPHYASNYHLQNLVAQRQIKVIRGHEMKVTEMHELPVSDVSIHWPVFSFSKEIHT